MESSALALAPRLGEGVGSGALRGPEGCLVEPKQPKLAFPPPTPHPPRRFSANGET